MRQFFAPRGDALTPDILFQRALDLPESQLETLGGSVADMFNTSLFGTPLREAQIPDVASVPVAAGRGGMRWETPAQVQERGDYLFQSPEDYAKSPYYRTEVPFEKGMTESRAKALSEWHDLSQVRDFYSAKRPVTAFIGGVIGSLVAPENFIPILDEATLAATTARIGKLAGRMFIGGADAALNTAIFQTLTAPERAKLGDDTSWQTLFQNMAFSALAGAAFRGVGHTVSAVRERYTKTPELPGTIVYEAPIGPTREVSLGGQAADITVHGSEAPRFGEQRVVTPNQILDRIETPNARLQAAQVLNDAVTGLAIDGHVSLGEQSRANVEALSSSVRASKPFVFETAKESTRIEPPAPVAKKVYENEPNIGKQISQHMYALAHESGLAEDIAGRINSGVKGNKVVYEFVSDPRSLNIKTSLNEAYGDVGRFMRQTIVADIVKHIRQDGIKVSVAGSEIPAVKVGTASESRSEIAPATPQLSYHVPPPDPPPPSFDATKGRITEGVSVPKDIQAEMARMTKSAKEEGIDPETGTHDLQDDIEILKKQDGRITKDEMAALEMADTNYKSAQAWEDVAIGLLKCRT